MSNTVAVGTTTRTKETKGLFQMQWVSVFGVYVPEDWQPTVLLELMFRGYEAKALGHTIQVQTDPDDPTRLDDVRKIIREMAEECWRRANPQEWNYWLQQAENQMMGMSQ